MHTHTCMVLAVLAVLAALCAQGLPVDPPCPFQPEPFMQEAIEVAQDAVQRGQAPFGAIIVDVRDPCVPQIVAVGANNASYNPLWHGEMVAINNLAQEFTNVPLTVIAPQMVLITTAEPCPMCMGAIEWTGFQAVFFGSTISYLMSQGWGQINITAAELAQRTFITTHPNIRVVGGILQEQTNTLYNMK